MTDEEAVAIIALGAEKSMQQNLQGSQALRHNRTDWRKFLGGNGGQQRHPGYDQGYNAPQQHYPQQNYNYPPQQYNQGQPVDGPVDLNPVRGLLPIPVLKDEQGRNILPPELSNLQPNQISSGLHDTTGFNLPNYGGKSESKQQSNTIDIEFKFDLIMKEIKSLKKVVNKLIKTIEDANVDKGIKPEPEKVDETNS